MKPTTVMVTQDVPILSEVSVALAMLVIPEME